MNNVVLLGRITQDIELKYTANTNKAFVKFILAVNRKGKDAGTDFITCQAWDKTAEFMQKYLKKGSQICISGRIQTGQYDDKDGKRVYTTDIVAEEIDFADTKQKQDNPFTENLAYSFKGDKNDIPPVIQEEMPF